MENELIFLTAEVWLHLHIYILRIGKTRTRSKFLLHWPTEGKQFTYLLVTRGLFTALRNGQNCPSVELQVKWTSLSLVELYSVSHIDFLRMGMTRKKFTTKSYNTNSTGNVKYFSHSSNLMRVRKISGNRNFHQLSVKKNYISTNDQLERVVRRTRPIQP